MIDRRVAEDDTLIRLDGIAGPIAGDLHHETDRHVSRADIRLDLLLLVVRLEGGADQRQTVGIAGHGAIIGDADELILIILLSVLIERPGKEDLADDEALLGHHKGKLTSMGVALLTPGHKVLTVLQRREDSLRGEVTGEMEGVGGTLREGDPRLILLKGEGLLRPLSLGDDLTAEVA